MSSNSIVALPLCMNIYISLFGSNFSIFHLLLNGLLPIMAGHGIKLAEFSSDFEARLAIIEHIFLGNCCKLDNQPFRCCKSYSSVFSDHTKMKEFFCGFAI